MVASPLELYESAVRRSATTFIGMPSKAISKAIRDGTAVHHMSVLVIWLVMMGTPIQSETIVSAGPVMVGSCGC